MAATSILRAAGAAGSAGSLSVGRWRLVRPSPSPASKPPRSGRVAPKQAVSPLSPSARIDEGTPGGALGMPDQSPDHGRRLEGAMSLAQDVRDEAAIGRSALARVSWRLLPLLGVGYGVAY